MPDEQRLEEQALSQAVEIGISAQLDEVENISVDVQTNLLKLAQGQADSISVAGTGLVMQKDIRVQEVELQTDSIALNLLSTLFGKVKLNQPIDTTARIVMTQDDINRALNSDYILSQLPPLELSVEGQNVPVEIQPPLELQLPGEGKLVFRGTMRLHEAGKTRQVGFTATIFPRTPWQPLLLEGFSCEPGAGVSIEFTIALMEKMKELVSLPYIEFQGTVLRITELEVQQGSMTVQTEAHVYHLPSS